MRALVAQLCEGGEGVRQFLGAGGREFSAGAGLNVQAQDRVELTPQAVRVGLMQNADGLGDVQVVVDGLCNRLARRRVLLVAQGVAALAHARPEFVDLAQRLGGRAEAVIGEGQFGAIVGGQAEIAIGEGVEAVVHQFLHGQEVAAGLGHLFGGVAARDGTRGESQKRAVDPEPGEDVTRRALGLGDLVGVVDRDVVNAAAVDVQRLAQIIHAHGGTFDVPAGVADAPGRLPLHDVGRLVGEPQNEVGGVALAGVHVDIVPRPFLLRAEIQAGQLAVVGVAGRIEVDALGGLIGKSLSLKSLWISEIICATCSVARGATSGLMMFRRAQS